jgi:hypothetical protein
MVVGLDGRLTISHGFTFIGRFDDTRAYDLGAERWSIVVADGRRPGQRCLHDCFTSASGQLVLYGGQNDTERALGDLWSIRAAGGWRQGEDPASGARRLYAVAEAGGHAWIFGGAARDDEPLGDLWRVDRETLRFERVRPRGSEPARRYASTLIADAPRGRLLLFGGQSRAALADVWELSDGAATDPESDATEATDLETDATEATDLETDATEVGTDATDLQTDATDLVAEPSDPSGPTSVEPGPSPSGAPSSP